MYKLLLSWRYLRSKYIALASIISVTLGVATMIVVNAVMAGFSQEMQDRMHGVLSDLVFEARSLDGAPDADRHMAMIRELVGDQIEGMSPTVRVPAMLGYYVGDQYRTQQIMMIGVDEATYSNVSDFGRYLQHSENREQLSFDLKSGGYDTIDPQAEDPSKVKPRVEMQLAGWEYRRRKAAMTADVVNAGLAAGSTGRVPPPTPQASDANASGAPVDPFTNTDSVFAADAFDPAKEQHIGAVLGMALAAYRAEAGNDVFLTRPGDDIEITYPSAGRPPKPLAAKFTVVDFYESKMQEYDASFVFVPLRQMQILRGMVDLSTCDIDPETGLPDKTTGVANFNAIQIKLKPGADANAVRDRIAAAFAPQYYLVSTWQDKQGALLAAVQMETAVLNVLLFLIIAVAGFGILAIFSMIVVEKTRDIGILKSLGASGGGVMGIFLGYGLALGMVGAGVGAIGGLLFVEHINEIADLIGQLTGAPVFDPSIYYFHKIPTIIDPFTVTWIAIGAVLIAVFASILPANRAANMHPVTALRWN